MIEKCEHCCLPVVKAIYFGAPMRYCPHCTLATGLGATLANWFAVGDDEGDFALFMYEGGYWRALWAWLTR
jgi:hypothetical protein